MLDSRQNSDWSGSLVLSPLGRIWPFCIWAALLHVSIACLFLWEQEAKPLFEGEEMGHPVEIFYLEEKPALQVSTSAQKEKIPEEAERSRQKPMLQTQENLTEVEGGTSLPSATQTKPTLLLKAGNPHPPYPEYARENAIEGKVIAILKIEASTGIVQEVKIVEPRTHTFLEESVIDTVKNWRFQPINSPGLIEEMFPFTFHLIDDN